MTNVVLLSDTHVPSRATAIPDWVLDAIEEAAVVIHAGDFDSFEAYDEIRTRSARLIAVKGNADPELGLDTMATIEVSGCTFLITHGSGPLRGYHDRLQAAVASREGIDIVVSGHTHEVHDRSVDGVRYLNPGSATAAAPSKEASLMQVTVFDGQAEVELRRVP